MMAGTVLVCTLVACNKEQEVKEETNPENEVELVTEVIRASWDEGETKGNIAEVGGAFTWSEGDKIAVHTNNDGGTWYYSQALVAGDEGQTSANFTTTFAGTRDAVAVFPNSLVTEGADALSSGLTVTLPSSYALADVQGDKAPTPMVAVNTGETLAFKHLCGLLRLTINGIPADATKLTVDFLGRKVYGDFTIAAGNLTPGDDACIISTESGCANDVITITGLDGSVSSVTVNIPLPAGTYDDVVITPYNGDDALKLMAVRHIKGGSYTASRAHRRKLTATLVSFSVAADKKVVFAPGNLQYIGSAATPYWKFADNQYDYFGSTTGQGSTDSNVDRDLFGWGTSGWSLSGVTSWTNNMPWATTKVKHTGESDYENNLYGYGPDTPYGLFDNEVGHDYSNGDWGVFNQIGSYDAGTWRTPTGGSGEWTYLLTTRAESMYSFAKAYLDTDDNGKGDVHGLIILPDNYTHPTDVDAIEGINITGSTYWSSNTYNSTDWEKMEAAGCIFLPAAGERNESTVTRVNSYAYYWSSVSAGNTNASALWFRDSVFAPGGSTATCGGHSVRLVRDLN